jgi:hypothetical protein
LPLGPGERAQAVQQCLSVFPRGRWRATQVIEAKLPLGNEGSFIGVVAAGPGARDFRALLMTQEGFVLFDARYRAGHVEVLRVLPPLDPEGFGRGMTGDVRLMSFPPSGKLVEVGASSRNEHTCRWREGKETVEVALVGTGQARLLRYDDGQLEREVFLTGIDAHGFAHRASLETKGLVGYSLSLTLLEVEPPETTADRSPASQ